MAILPHGKMGGGQKYPKIAPQPDINLYSTFFFSLRCGKPSIFFLPLWHLSRFFFSWKIVSRYRPFFVTYSYTSKSPKNHPKIWKIGIPSWLAQPTPVTPRPTQIAFYGSLGMFKVIFDQNGFFRDCCTLGVGAHGHVLPTITVNHRKSSKITEN